MLLRCFFHAWWDFRIFSHIISIPVILGHVGLKRTGSGEVKRKRGRPANVSDLRMLMLTIVRCLFALQSNLEKAEVPSKRLPNHVRK